jgi:hypothetical protein
METVSKTMQEQTKTTTLFFDFQIMPFGKIFGGLASFVFGLLSIFLYDSITSGFGEYLKTTDNDNPWYQNGYCIYSVKGNGISKLYSDTMDYHYQ